MLPAAAMLIPEAASQRMTSRRVAPFRNAASINAASDAPRIADDPVIFPCMSPACFSFIADFPLPPNYRPAGRAYWTILSTKLTL
ncbi:MAG TPA: hypothetical protein VMC10_19015, partial [Stellaceae bacterium]|nr:hypothetical protein [Stellaceae bacterium]